MEAVDVNRRLVGQLPRGEYTTGFSFTTAVDPVAVKGGIRSHSTDYDRTL